MLVRAVIIHDQMEFDLARKLLVQPFKKLEKLLMPMMGVALADHFDLRDFQSGEERCSAIALIIVSHSSTPALFDRQSRLSSVQGLNLTLFIHTQHQSFLRRIEIKPNSIRQLLEEIGITGEFETFVSMWL
jgi:hypothetical protein